MDKWEKDKIWILATEENSRDLEWFLDRYPMKVRSAEILRERAGAYDAKLVEVERINSGAYRRPVYSMALPPRPYQSKTAALVENTRGVLCADELGLGKTVTGLALLSNPNTLPALVVCPTHLPVQWERECHRFLPALTTHIIQKGTFYEIGTPDIVIVNYHKLRGWSDHLAEYVNSVIFDECQDLRIAGSYKYDAAKQIADMADFRLGCSATPIYNYGVEFFSLMDVLAPGFLGDRDEFLREWCDTRWAVDRTTRITEPAAFGSYLRDAGRLVLHTRAEVKMELPAVTKVVQEIEADLTYLKKVESAATELARFILAGNAESGFELMKASQEFSNTLRQATGIAKAPYIAAFVDMLLQSGPDPVLLFCWHREVYSILLERLKHYNPVMFTGSESAKQKQAAIDAFIGGQTRLLVMSLRSGTGVDGLQKVCSRVVFGELDWSPGAMEQCIGRLHRDGQENPVFVYYLTATTGCDPVMIDVIGAKKEQLEGVLDPDKKIFSVSMVDPQHVKKLAEDYLKRG